NPMKARTTLSAIGGWHSFFFCVGMYFVALFFSIFVCSSIFYVVNGAKSSTAKDSYTEKTAGKQVLASINH
ncbi:MAG TPA: hypothetical protein VFV08_08235, partial [Puia sp.]|nr:hypothetical protein [Puia sp.]